MQQLQIKGYILPVMLLMLQIFSLLSINSLLYTSEMIAATRQFWERDQHLQMGLKILDDIEKQISSHLPVCLFKQMSTPLLREKPMIWWQLYGCSDKYDATDYFFIIEDLGINPCGIIGKSKYNENIIAAYYRITLFMLLDKKRNEKLFLQSTFVRAALQDALCPDKPHRVLLGNQMWREV